MSAPNNQPLISKVEEIGRTHVPSAAVAKEVAALKGRKPTTDIGGGIHPLWYKELTSQDIPAPSWIVDRFIPDESITILSALPGKFKTWLAFDIAIHVANGEPLFGQLQTKQTKVLIIDEESGPGRLRQRLQMLGIHDDTQIAVASYSGFKLTEANAKSLISYCHDQGIGFVVFDSLTRIHDGDENTAKDMSVVMGNFKRLAQAGLAVLLIHHNRKPGLNNKGGANEMRGSIDILAACDAQISLKRAAGADYITVTQNKNRDAEDVAAFNLQIIADENTFQFGYMSTAPKSKTRHDQAEEQILKLLDGNSQMFQGEITAAISDTIGEKTAVKILEKMVSEHKISSFKGDKNKTIYTVSVRQSDG